MTNSSRYSRWILAFALTLLVAAISSVALAQNPPNYAGDQLGMQPYQPYHGGDIDAVNLYTGTLNINYPFLSYPQRGKLHFSFNLMYNNGWQHVGQLCIPGGRCLWIWGYSPGGYIPDAYVSTAQAHAIVGSDDGVVRGSNTFWYGKFSIRNADGSKNPIGNLGSLTQVGPSPPYYEQASGPFESLDATGWRVNGALTPSSAPISNPIPTSIIGPDGVLYDTASAFEEDPNGNRITLSSNVFTDSLGRQVPAGYSSTDTSGCPQPPQVLLTVDHALLWSVPGPGGAAVNYKFCYAQVTVNIPPTPPSGYLEVTQMKLQSIVLPNTQTWNFEYNDPGDGSTYGGLPVNYGTLTQIALPTGGTISYQYITTSTPNGAQCQTGGRFVTSRSVNANDGTGSHTWTYSYAGTSTTVTDPLGNYALHTFTTFQGCANYDAQVQFYQSGGTLMKTVATTYNYSYPGVSDGFLTNVAPAQITTTWANGRTTSVTKSYDAGFTYKTWLSATSEPGIYGKVISESAYDYGQGGSGPLLRTTKTGYLALYNSSYLTNNLLDAVSSLQVLDNGGAQRALTTYGYDEYALASSGVSTQHDSSPPTGTSRGNQTSVYRWLNGSTIATATCNISVSNGYLVSYATYYDTGTVSQSVNSCGTSASDTAHMTQFTYSASYAGAYPTTITNPLGQQTNHTYDFNTGLLASTTDPNSQTTSLGYDNMWRVNSVTYPDGGLSTVTRQETTPPFSATLTKKITSSQNFSATNIFDGLGRISESQVADPQGPVKTDTAYDADGRKSTVSNPYRTANDPTYGVTTFQYDGLSRLILVTKPGGNTVQTAYCASTTLVTDEAGRWRRSTTDGLGRLTEVDEPNSTTASVNVCPGTGEPIWVTTYSYNALDDLSSAVQGSSRSRSFAYDSLKHLTSSTNPEAGNVTYGYDAVGDVITKADARGVTVTYTYDVLSRMAGKTYSNGDPAVSYAYDQSTCIGQSACYNVGRRTSMADAGGSELLSYDKMGREWGEQRTTSGVTKTTTYTYNYDGSLSALTYPSGRVLTYTTDSAGRASEAQDLTNSINYVTGTCANGVNNLGTCYTSPGAVASLVLGQAGSFAGIALSNTYNARLEPSELKASSSAGTAMDLVYSFVDANGHNNGNVIGITNNKDTTRSQSFAYDQVNRMSSAQTSSTSGSNCWGETFGYDQWANLTSIGAVSGYGVCVQEMLSVGANANNQLSATGFSYDVAGNMLGDGLVTYVWNGESEIKTASGVNYTYDGDGNRVQKSSGKLYWYGAGSEILDESDLSGNITDEYVFFGGKRVAHRVVSSGSIYYYAEDFLGTSRVMTTSSGTVCYEADFYPYGGERVITNTCAQNYKFEGKERDTETQNDNFGARYYISRLGRWLSADWSAVPAPVPYANLTNPQTLNLYAMVGDNPETFADLDGHLLALPGPITGSSSLQRSENEAEASYAAGVAAAMDPAAASASQAPQTSAQAQEKRKPKPKRVPKPKMKPRIVAVGEMQPLKPAVTPQGGHIKQQDVHWTAEIMQGNVIVGDLPDATITMQEKQIAGNDKPVICDTPCSDTGTLVDTQHVYTVGAWSTLQQWFTVNGQAVDAIVVRPDGTVVAQGSTIQVTSTASGSTFTGVP